MKIVSMTHVLGLLATALLLTIPQNVFSADHEDSHDHDAEEAAPQAVDARPQMVKITPAGIVPAQLTMNHSDSVVFFYNNTEDDLATLEVDFGPRVAHCASSLRIVKEPGLARTRKPFGPKEFASTCFHEKGTYTYKVYTSDKSKSPFTGIVNVQ